MISLIIVISNLILILIIYASYLYIKYVKNKSINENIPKTNHISPKNKNKPLMIIGPSGVGKDTFMQKIINKYPNIFVKCVSSTTRLPRENEKEGINYFFISKEKFEDMDKNGEIIGKFEKYGNLYGTSKYQLEKISSNENIVYFDYNIETAIKTFKEKKVDFNYIALLPPDINELERRLRKRGTDNEESITKRINYAKREIELINESKFLNYVIKNDKLEKSFNDFEKSIKILYFHLFE